MSNPTSILLAEDDENDVFFLRRAFKGAGIENPFRVVRDGQFAIDYLAGAGEFGDREQYPLPRLLILDLKMPRKTGMDVLRWKHEQLGLETVPTLVLTGSAHRHDVEEAYRLGASAFVVKPSSVEHRNALAKVIKGFWLDFNQPPLVCIEGLEQALKHYTGANKPRKFL